MREMIFLFFNFSNKLEELIFWMFNSKILLIAITVIKISSIFVFEISMVFFVRFFDYVDFIVYAFEIIITFFLFVELMFSTRIIKNVFSKYKI